ncbi:hypothetical protein [Paracoccus yeei]|uniref:hypothetical protein n=1 Tax=Paracoccus yeei TaxID=147645 RepID=UPI0011C39BB1|nr:hypothetical protein [Paracoccus yeei]
MVSKEVENLASIDRFGVFPEIEPVIQQNIILKRQVRAAFDLPGHFPLRYKHLGIVAELGVEA